jgi:hypothetical protein
MSLARSLTTVSLVLVALAGAGCGGPRYRMTDPPSFKRFHDEEGLRMITADGVMLKVRKVENYPEAPLAFWVEAMKRHLVEQGYAAQGEPRSFETRKGLRGARLLFLVPRSTEDWVLGETIFVVGKRIVLVESAGPYPRHAPLEQEIEQALLTFEPGPA